MLGLPLDDASAVKSSILNRKYQLLTTVTTFFILLMVLTTTNLVGYVKIYLQPLDTAQQKQLCPIHSKIVPSSYASSNTSVAWQIINDPEFREQSVAKLSAAVQIDTQITDNQPDVPDAPEVWAKFAKFHRYLNHTFANVYSHPDIEISTVNTYGLVYHWHGSDPSLKPVLLTAHQDVVPVQSDTLKDWTYPPFAGHYNGTHLFGRGATDCKNVLVAIMESLQLLIDADYRPQRSIMVAFGFDEESSGFRGAQHISRFLLDKFGPNSLYALIDEGVGVTMDPLTGKVVAQPAVGEKGYMDVLAELVTPGGHSSVSPDHTAIGIMGELTYLIELDPYEAQLTTRNPTLHYLQCLATNSPSLPSGIRKTILRAHFDKLANSKVMQFLQKNPFTKYLIQTSQSIDIVKGGEKANSLPENVKLITNHRIAVESSIQDVERRFLDRVFVLAKKHNLKVIDFSNQVAFDPQAPKGTITLSHYSRALQPAPVSPSNDTVWKYLAGTTRHIFEDLVFTNLSYLVITAPSLMPANTDTRYYWDLTPNIYRYSAFFSEDLLKETHVHSVDERIRFDAHLQLLAFFYQYIQNVDTKDADN